MDHEKLSFWVKFVQKKLFWGLYFDEKWVHTLNEDYYNFTFTNIGKNQLYVNSPGVIHKAPYHVKGEGGSQEITLNHKEEGVHENNTHHTKSTFESKI